MVNTISYQSATDMQNLEHAWYEDITGLEHPCTTVSSYHAQIIAKTSGFWVNMCIWHSVLFLNHHVDFVLSIILLWSFVLLRLKGPEAFKGSIKYLTWLDLTTWNKGRCPVLSSRGDYKIHRSHKLFTILLYYENHDDVNKWKHFPRYWPFVWGIHRSPVNSPHKGQWRGALMFSVICARINGWVNNREAGGWRRNHALYDVTVMDSVHLVHRTKNTGSVDIVYFMVGISTAYSIILASYKLPFWINTCLSFSLKRKLRTQVVRWMSMEWRL